MEVVGILGLAAFWDYLIGDPWGWPHPVRVMGWVIAQYQTWALRFLSQPQAQRWGGVGLAIGMIGGSIVTGQALLGLIAWGLEALGVSHRQWWVAGVHSILLASCFAGRSLRDAVNQVLAPLVEDDLGLARARLSLYVGRDTVDLDRPEILRAILETATENAVDGVLAPLFYALLGAWLPVGSAPLALGYKAASTLDSMVGYKEPPYRDLGWFSARLEDGLTWLPCRLAVGTIALLSGKPKQVLRLCRRDAAADPSPNAGWSECVYAAALGVQLGGMNTYKGVKKAKPLLGDPLHPITVERIQLALRLTRYSFLIWLAGGATLVLMPMILGQ